MMHRRTALQILAAAPWLGAIARGEEDGPPRPRTSMGLVIHSFWVRRERPLAPDFPPLSDPVDFVAAAARFGAAGIQAGLGVRDADYLKSLRNALEKHRMYFEGIAALPKNDADVARFDEELRVASEAGAKVVRTVCMNGRRYETFDAAEQFRQFAEQSWNSLQLAEPVAARQKIGLAVENHKDLRVEEMLGWLNRLSSEYVGVCLDTGNSIALLEEPHEVVEAYAPWTFTTHFKDMGVAEYEDGFLLSEVPLGRGYLDLPRVVATVRKAHPEARLNLEMITRDPLRVPCLTKKYWATLGAIPGSVLAGMLADIRRRKSPRPLPVVSGLGHRAQLEVEAAKVIASLDYAREKLKL
ncbi:MAG: sugar phosphate isomerase/epimerase family protein [Deltaproteobacteria bacterium]